MFSATEALTGSSASFTNSAMVSETAFPVASSIDTAACATSMKLSPAILPLPARLARTDAAAPVVPTVALTCLAILPSWSAVSPAELPVKISALL
ncbi:hypothetical protein D3C78_1260830 [compost metagenome]